MSNPRSIERKVTVPCFHLAQLLRANNLSRVDFMSIDTEGSEEGIILDFPWARASGPHAAPPTPHPRGAPPCQQSACTGVRPRASLLPSARQ